MEMTEMTPEEVHEELLQLGKQVVTKEELRSEFKQRESEAAIGRKQEVDATHALRLGRHLGRLDWRIPYDVRQSLQTLALNMLDSQYEQIVELVLGYPI